MSDLWQPPFCEVERAELQPGTCLDGGDSRCLNECRFARPEPGPTPADQRGDPNIPHRYVAPEPSRLEPVLVDATQGVVIFDFADRPATVIDGECVDCDNADLDDGEQKTVPWTGTWPDGWVPLGATRDGLVVDEHGVQVLGAPAPLPDRTRLGPGELFTDPRPLDTATSGRTVTVSFQAPEITAENLTAALTGDSLWTIGDALQFLDPHPPRRTVARWLRALPPIGWRELPQGGPRARTYRASEIMARHARWAKSHTRKTTTD